MSADFNIPGIKDFDSLICEFEAALKDLRSLNTPSDILRINANSPLISNWSFAYRAVPWMVGEFKNHPVLAQDAFGTTTEILFFDPVWKIARTRNRWYALGEPNANSLSE